MAPRIVFANLPFGPNSLALWDQAFADVGNSSIIACTAATPLTPNSFILTPITAAYGPSLTSYANFYGLYTFIGTATTTGTVTANVGGLGLLNVYLSNGTTQASTGDILINGFYALSYSAALNAGSGGFYLVETGGGQLTLSGDITVNGGVATITNNAITYGKIQQASQASVFLANPTGSAANYQEVTTGPTLTFVGTTVQTAAMTGDVVTTANSFATTIAAGVVTPAKMAAIPALTVLGNNTSGATSPITLTQSQFTDLVNLFTPIFRGAVPASGGGNINFLRADGAWAPAAGGIVLLKTIPATVPLAALTDITSFTIAFNNYYILFSNVLPTVNGAPFVMEVSTNSGVSWQTTNYNTVAMDYLPGGVAASGSAANFLLFNSAANAAGYGISGSGTFCGLPLSNVRKNFFGQTMGRQSPGQVVGWNIGGHWDGSNSPITGLRWRFTSVDVSGNSIASGTIKVYGVS